MAVAILTPLQQKFLSLLKEDMEFVKSFYFTGGTVLAHYYLHHRLSEDLDFFSQKEVDTLYLSTLINGLKRNLNADKVDFQQSFNRNIVFFTIGESLLKTEFTYFPFTQVENPLTIQGIKVDSLTDIAVNKFFTIYQNPSARHFIDLYLIIKEKKISWDELAKLARVKFDVNIDPLQLGGQLITVKDLPDLPKMVIKLDENEWRNFFLEKSKELKSQIEK